MIPHQASLTKSKIMVTNLFKIHSTILTDLKWFQLRTSVKMVTHKGNSLTVLSLCIDRQESGSAVESAITVIYKGFKKHLSYQFQLQLPIPGQMCVAKPPRNHVTGSQKVLHVPDTKQQFYHPLTKDLFNILYEQSK